MKKLIIIIGVVLSPICTLAQHNAMYSQYMFNGLLINPAFAGASDMLSIVMLHRNQWTGFDCAPVTSTVSAHTPLKNKKINFGLSFQNDRFGITHHSKFDLSYAYRLFFPKGSLAFGVQGGVNILRYEWSNIQLTNPGDKVFTEQDQLTSSPEAGAGLYFRTEKFYLGASAPALISFVEPGLSYQPTLVTAGYVFFLPNDIELKHSILLKYIKNSPFEANINFNFYYKDLGLGFSYRTGDSFIFLLEYNINPQFCAGYSYDMTISKLGAYNKGSHEIMLRYEFGYSVNAKNPRYF